MLLQQDACSSMKTDNGELSFPAKKKSVGAKLKQRLQGAARSTKDNVLSPFDISMTSITSSCSVESCISTVQRPGCMKGTSITNRPNRKVRFAKHTIVYKITPLFEFVSQLWWQRSEIEKCKEDQYNLDTESDECKEAIRRYIHGYMQAYDEVFQITDKRPFNDMISSKFYELIVEGRSKGFGGLELYCDQRQKRKEIRTRILLTIAAYHHFTQQQKQGGSIHKNLRKYSRSLTAADRYWALVLGNADAAR
jgi:hypothetical protein